MKTINLPKQIVSKIGEPEYIWHLECEIQSGVDGRKRYILSYINHLWKDCLFFVSNYDTGFDYKEMLRQLNGDVNWKEVK